ncbi:MAG: hypothetical protein HUU20_22020 [Pirellulales bacterium]|nr:hypothetical protein [Pirellulales bacterium]
MASNNFVQQPLMMLSERAVPMIHESALGLLRRLGIRVAPEKALGLLSDEPSAGLKGRAR